MDEERCGNQWSQLSNYSTPVTTIADSGAQFSVSVSNGSGTASSNSALLSVTAPIIAPAITLQPMAQSVTAGQTANFSVATTGTAPITYQWSRNGSPIIGATSSLYMIAFTYNAYVMAGSVQATIGPNLALRTEQPSVSKLAYLNGLTEKGSDTICPQVPGSPRFRPQVP